MISCLCRTENLSDLLLKGRKGNEIRDCFDLRVLYFYNAKKILRKSREWRELIESVKDHLIKNFEHAETYFQPCHDAVSPNTVCNDPIDCYLGVFGDIIYRYITYCDFETASQLLNKAKPLLEKTGNKKLLSDYGKYESYQIPKYKRICNEKE